MKQNHPSRDPQQPTQPIRRVVDGLARGWGRGDMCQESAIRLIWETIIGPARAKNTQVAYLKGDVLVVRVANEAMQKEIRLLETHLLSACNQHISGKKIRRIQVRVGTLSQATETPKPKRPRTPARTLDQSDADAIKRAVRVIENDELRESVGAWMRAQAARRRMSNPPVEGKNDETA